MAELSIVSSQPLPAAGGLTITSSQPLPAAKKPYDAATRGAKLKGDTDPNALGDSFVGTLATDAAKLPGQVIDFPLQAVHAMQHPVDSIKDALVGFYNLPGQTLDELKAGKYGKVGARIFELLAPGMSTEEGAALASRSAAKVAEAATPVVDALGTAGTATRGAVSGGAKAMVSPKTMVGAGTAEYVAGHLGLPSGVGAAAVAGPRIVKGAITGAKEALAARIARAAEAVTAPEVAAEAAGQVTAEGLAKAAGQDWSKLSANDRGILEHVAQAQNNAAAAPARPFVGPVQPPATSVPAEAPQAAPVAPGKTLADVLREEMDAKRAAAAPAPAPAPAPVVAAPPVEAPQPLQYGHTPTPIVSRGTPLRPPLATETRAQWEAATQQAPPVVEVPPARSLAQTNADMARKAPAPIDPSEVRTEFAPSGERKSPQLRAAEITAANRAAKAQRFAHALHANGVSAAEAAQIEAGALSDSQIREGMTPRWGDIARSLGENSPSDISVPMIIKELRGLEGAAKKAAAPVAVEPAPSPAGPVPITRNTAPGGGMGSMKNYWSTPETPPVLTSPAVESRVSTDVPPRAENQVAEIPQSGQSGNSSRYGEAVAVRVPGENRSYQARYAIRELSEVKPSHNPVTLQSNPEYAYSNDRNYADPRNSERIIKQTSEFDPNYLVSDSPDATNGAPIIDRNGNVLGGNSRTMTLARVYQGKTGGAAYRELLTKKAAQFGLDPAHVAEMKHPVLVRELSHEISGEAAQPIITDLNKTGTASLTGAERAIADSNKLSASTMEQMAGMIESQGPDGTLAKALEGKGGAFIADQLVKDGVITTQEKPGLFDSAGNITAAAKDRISKLMLGRVFRDSAQFEGTPPAIRNKLERIMAPLSRVAGKEEWNLAPDVREAVDMLERARAAGSKNLDDLVAQQGLFGGGEEFSPRAVSLAKIIQSKGPLELAKDFARYANDSKGPTMFGEVTPGEAFAELTGIEPPKPPANYLRKPIR